MFSNRGNYGNWELGIENFRFFPSRLCPELLDGTNECHYILVHKILLQLQLYHCNSLLFTYIHQNNHKVEEKNITNKIAFLIGNATVPIFNVLCKTSTFQLGFPGYYYAGQYFRLGNLVFP